MFYWIVLLIVLPIVLGSIFIPDDMAHNPQFSTTRRICAIAFATIFAAFIPLAVSVSPLKLKFCEEGVEINSGGRKSNFSAEAVKSINLEIKPECDVSWLQVKIKDIDQYRTYELTAKTDSQKTIAELKNFGYNFQID